VNHSPNEWVLFFGRLLQMDNSFERADEVARIL